MKKYIFPILILALALSSCEDIIDIELNNEDIGLYAVEAAITTQDEPSVFLYKGLPVNADELFLGVSDAVVTITDDATPVNTITLTESDEQQGLYIVPEGVDYYGVADREYTIDIQIGDVSLSGSDKLNPVEPIDSIRVWPSSRGDNRFLGIFTYGKETPGLGNYYMWDIYINDTLVNEAEYLFVVNDDFVDGNYVDGLEIFTDFHNPNDTTEKKLNYSDQVSVVQKSISEFGYDYYYQVLNQSFGGNMFSVPSANIPSNFTSSDGKDVLGLFIAHDVSISNTVIIDDYVVSELKD